MVVLEVSSLEEADDTVSYLLLLANLLLLRKGLIVEEDDDIYPKEDVDWLFRLVCLDNLLLLCLGEICVSTF